jgi:hypothetical protein
MKGRTAQFLVVIAIGFVLTGCASESALGPAGGSPSTLMPVVPTVAPTHSTDESIEGNWRLTSGVDTTGTFDIDNTIVTLTVNGSDSGGRAPCNSYALHITGTTAGAITIKQGSHTEIACVDSERNALETRYFGALNHVSVAALKGQTLVLRGDGVELDFAPSAASS